MNFELNLKFGIRIFFSMGLMSSKGTLISLVGSYTLYALFVSVLVKELGDRWREKQTRKRWN